MLEPLTTVTHGYQDVRTWMHGSAFESGVTIYKFDGRQYRAVYCADYLYTYQDSRGEWHETKRPRITQEPCD